MKVVNTMPTVQLKTKGATLEADAGVAAGAAAKNNIFNEMICCNLYRMHNCWHVVVIELASVLENE